jgi:hypothetical protein
MPLRKLSPTDLQAEEWKCSKYERDTVVRAKDEEEARDVATNSFAIATQHTTQSTLINP